MLLELQHRLGISSSLKKLPPVKTICNYHLKNTFYCSDPNIEIKTIRPLFANGKEIKTIVDIYSVLLKASVKKLGIATIDSSPEFLLPFHYFFDRNKKSEPIPHQEKVQIFSFGGRYRTRTYDLPHVKRML